ncbi:hypothetical protein FAIPA1_410031 [Frankia sp. AiPs1]
MPMVRPVRPARPMRQQIRRAAATLAESAFDRIAGQVRT